MSPFMLPQEFSLSDVKAHDTEDDIYIAIHGKVYNVTSFLQEHPGGAEFLLEVAGEDATEAYDNAGHSDEAHEILPELEVGTLKSDPASKSDPVQRLPDPIVQHAKETGTKILKPDVFQEFELEEKTLVSHNVAIPDSIFGLPIGQHISIGAMLPQPDGTTKEIIRSYTPISGDHQPGYFDLLIKAYPQGNISQHVASLKLGDKIRIRGPKGAFIYTPNMVRHFGMIAGGTGITPMLQIIRAIMRGRGDGDKTEVDLIFANVNVEDILLKKDLDEISQDPGIRVHFVLNNPPENWTGGVGFVTEEMIQAWLPKPENDVKILLCGPPPMVSGMKKITESLGFEKARPVSKLEDQVFAF
ncbi:NADH-cytochrome b5 reductase [Fusarium irregulare]|uniref:NADH-cytochrome b5 reductase 1 n=1 Tax=Fusarium irregulare TaxID=2494466 RepID=A0A9W8PG28_9HYPO|nr:NADH-cytochrome b5 reductase [Fusarium irregulare]KAJ4006235.1 NADH-cytochrome b5 reductase [Fusarium irregulare]